jgi:hypothetical protein
VMDFARELSEEWVGREAEILPRAGRVGREIEFSHEDVETGTYP